MMETIMDYKIGGLELRLKLDEKVFNPTTTSQILAENIEVREGCVALDLGCGVAPLAIVAAKKGAHRVYAVDIMEEACRYARENAALNGVSDKVEILCGDLFEPVKGMKFDLIIDDVSGMAERVARLSPWYPEPIPAGGEDGTEPTIKMLTQTRDYLKEDGVLYFPVLSLADSEKIYAKAKEIFKDKLKSIKKMPIRLRKELQEKIPYFQDLIDKGIVNIHKKGSRYCWNLEIFRAYL